MCMKYESLYSGMCWDYLFFDMGEDDHDSFTVLLRDRYGVTIPKMHSDNG